MFADCVGSRTSGKRGSWLLSNQLSSSVILLGCAESKLSSPPEFALDWRCGVGPKRWGFKCHSRQIINVSSLL